MKKNIFSGMILEIASEHEIPPKLLSTLSRNFKANGGKIKNEIQVLNIKRKRQEDEHESEPQLIGNPKYVLTNNPLYKNERNLTVIGPEWISACLSQEKRLEFPFFVIKSNETTVFTPAASATLPTTVKFGIKDPEANKLIISELQKIQQWSKSDRNDSVHRAHAYSKAIKAIKDYGYPITNYSQALKIHGIGQKTAEKIMEIIKTGHLARNDYQPEKFKVITEFSKIHGVGKVFAEKLYTKYDMRSLEDLRKRPDLFSKTQFEAALPFVKDFEIPIPRKEAQQIVDLVKETCNILKAPVDVIAAGSFRRGALECGDIDIILSPSSENSTVHDRFLADLVEKLTTSGFIISNLTTPRKRVYFGVCRLPNLPKSCPARRIDFLLTSFNERGACLLHFTGNDEFNRSLRRKANTLGYKLNQSGLYKRPKNGIEEWLAGETEEIIFELLNVPYRSPLERWTAFDTFSRTNASK